MGFYEHASTFAGLPVTDFDPENAPVSDPDGHAYRLRLDYGDERSIRDLFEAFLEDPNAERVTALVFGAWSEEMHDESTAALVEPLVAAADRLPRLKGLFLVDVTQDENEVSWIVQSDLSPLWSAFPRLEFLTVRGGGGLSLGTIAHDTLRELVVECGGLRGAVLQQVAAARLPELEHLELYLGEENYGWDGTMEQVAALLAADFPKLRHLGLRDAQEADAVAEVVAKSPILDRIEVLDLSLGALGDDGARALLATGKLAGLKRFDLHHHYVSDEVVAELQALPIEVEADRGDAEVDVYDGEEYRYIAVGE